MRIFISGVSCVGKTTMGPILANELGRPCFDLDHEIETFHGKKIRPLRRSLPSMSAYRIEAAKALVNLLNNKPSKDAVIIMPPSGYMEAYWEVVKCTRGVRVTVFDRPENILKRLVFFDQESNRIDKTLDDEAQQRYLRSIKNDIAYFAPSYKRANAEIAITDLDAPSAAAKVRKILKVMRKV